MRLPGSAACVESSLEEFRHGIYHRAHIEGHEYPAQHEYDPGVKFVMAHYDARLGGCSCETDNMFRSYVGSQDACADYEPAKISIRQEIISGVSLDLRMDQTDTPAMTAKYKTMKNQSSGPRKCCKFVSLN
jgi:hypothetical protein